MTTSAQKIRGLSARNIRFPTSSEKVPKGPTVSFAFVEIFTETTLKGYGYTLTTEVEEDAVVNTVKDLRDHVVGRTITEIFANFGSFLRELKEVAGLTEVFPINQVSKLALSALETALWDLWCRREAKPLWTLLVQLNPESLISTLDLQYLSDSISQEDIKEMLQITSEEIGNKVEHLHRKGIPCYSARLGNQSLDELHLRKMCKETLKDYFKRFSIKVGDESDKKNLSVIREELGPDVCLLLDAVYRWDVDEAIEKINDLKEYGPFIVLDPTSADDVQGTAAIAQEFSNSNVKIGTGRGCGSLALLKQLLNIKNIGACFLEPGRFLSITDMLAAMCLASKRKIPVCMEARRPGQCEIGQHLMYWYFVMLGGNSHTSMCASVSYRLVHEKFITPVRMKHGAYHPPRNPGASTEVRQDALVAYEFPIGSKWKEIKQSIYQPRKPSLAPVDEFSFLPNM